MANEFLAVALVEAGAENHTTIVFAMLLELASTFLKGVIKTSRRPKPDAPRRGPLGEPVQA